MDLCEFQLAYVACQVLYTVYCSASVHIQLSEIGVGDFFSNRNTTAKPNNLPTSVSNRYRDMHQLDKNLAQRVFVHITETSHLARKLCALDLRV